MNSSDRDFQVSHDKDTEESKNRTVKCQDNESISSGTEDINPPETLTNTISLCKPLDSDNTKIKCDGKIISCKNNTGVLSQEMTRKELEIKEFRGGGSHGDVIHKQVSTGDHWPVLLVSKDKHEQKKKPCKKKDPIAIERSNLVNVTKLVVKELIESSLKYGRMLDSEYVSLNHFFILLEHVMRHGLKSKKGILGSKKELWNLLETVEKYIPEASDITSSVRELPTVKTHLGRARAWLRLALMQKSLADFFRFLTDKKEEILIEFYEPGSLMLSEEAVVVGGLLVGLNIIDCNLCVKEEDLDSQQGVIDFSLYLRENSHSEPLPEGANSASMTAALDQKNYVEELNRHLNAVVTNLQQKVEQLQTDNTLMKEDLAIAKNQVLMLQEENSRLQCARREYFDEHHKKIVETQEDLILKRETYLNNQAGLENLCGQLKKKLQEESSLKQDIEQDLQTQIALKTEAEMALKLLEKGVHEKQDTIISLRRQIEDIKIINLQMYNKLQECENLVKEKTDQVSQLQKKVSEMTFSLQQLEAKANRAEQDYVLSEEARRKLGQQLAEKDQRRSILESDLKIEREWRASLQASLEELQEQLTMLQNELDACQQKSSEYEKLKKDFHCLRNTCQEYETALEEMGVQLSDSKLQLEDLKESHFTLKEAVWTSDKEATTCRQCSKPFSVARRKHHCRSCGDIFCRNCSDNTMPLPSSSKPVRVCDGCHTLLLQRYSAT
ncbi:RUN and FYVE domain-containing protein 2-like [Tachypleus tridentatus]|uniref:RUN and FYVE domain-containing protein 2-like n=1 Tax=Tachypleus tridentatus TaxID=6853 RepID=UPI003FCF7881